MMLAVCPIWTSKWRVSWIKRLVPPAVPNPRETLTRARMALTRRDIVILALLACLASGVALIRQPASPSLAAHDTAIREVILQQIDAFGRGDDAAAFALAAPDIQAQFVGPEVFIAMVKAHYRPVYTAHKLVFPNPARAVQTRPKHAFSGSI